MKLQVTQENLSRALNNVARVASTRNALPVLSNVLIKTVDNRVCVAATNLNIAITQYIGSKVSDKGSITAPARLMQDFISSLPGGVIDLNLEETKLHISTNKYKSVINGVPADDYPVMPSIKTGTKWSVPAAILKKSLSQVVFAASNDDARPILTGVFFNAKDGKLSAAATDSYRLAEKTIISIEDNISILVPSSSIQDLLRILGDTDDEVAIVCDEQQVQFTVGDTELVTRLIDGNYPDYKKLIPTKFKTSAVVDRGELLNIAKVSGLFARESAGSVILEADCDQKQVTIRSLVSQLGENSASTEAETSGESANITLNSRYLIDSLNAVNGDKVTIGFNEKLEPFVIRPTKDSTATHLVMPLKS